VPHRETLDPDSSIWHWIAVDLWFQRTKRKQTLAEIGGVVGLSVGAVSNLEAARAGFKLSDRQAKSLDEFWDLNGHFQRLLRYARTGHQADWLREHLSFEARATVIKVYALAVVPGLLQTEAYARRLFTYTGSKEVEAQVEARMARQERLFGPNPPVLWVLLDEGVLDRPVGGSELMHEQLVKLLELSGLHHVIVRVVPRSAGFNLGLEGSFKVLNVDGADLIYTEARGGGRLSLHGADVRSFNDAFDRIGAEALDQRSSRDLIRQIMEAM
jgi:hypothetical protein